MKAPWWVLWLVNALILTLVWILFLRFAAGEAWPGALVQGPLFGVVLGLFLSLVERRQFRRQREAVGEGDVATRVAARPTLTGPVPTDPAERAAALRLVEHQLAEFGRRRTRSVVLQLAFVVVGGWLALERSPWWWMAVVMGIAFLAIILLTQRRLERRAELLRGTTTEA